MQNVTVFPRELSSAGVGMYGVGLLLPEALMAQPSPLLAAVASAALFIVHPTVDAQSTQPQNRAAGWVAFYGCWRAEGAAAGEMLCIEPDREGVRMITVVDGRKREETRVIADDEWRDVVQDQCRGMERARWSRDRLRVFLNAELSCGSNTRRASSGVLAFTDESHWVSVQSVTVDGETATRSTRYELVRDGGAASHAARIAAASYVRDDDVDEASDFIDDAAVQEWLIASGAAYSTGSGSALHMLNRDGTRTVVVERLVYLRPYYRYYSPWGYDLYGWRPYRPVVFVNSHYHRYRERDRESERERARHRDRVRDHKWERERDARERSRDDGARVTREGYSRNGVRSTSNRNGGRPSRSTESSTRSSTQQTSTRQAKRR